MKIVIDGETFDYDQGKRPLSEALAIEKAWGRRYAEWQSELMAGSAEATAVLVWVVYRREGRDVPLADILEGRVDFDYDEVVGSIAAEYAAQQAQAAQQDPTPGAQPRTDQAGTATTSPATPDRSVKSSTSARGKSGSSPRTSSTP